MSRLLCLTVVLASVLGAAGCTSSSSSAPSPTTGDRRAAATGTPVQPAVLAGRLQHALAGARSVHIRLSTAVTGSSTITGSGDVALDKGTISAADITEALPNGLGSVRLVVAGGRTYARLPAGLAPKGTPWTLLSTSSTQPLVAQLATTVDSVLSVASPATVVTFVRSASSVRLLGPASLDTVPTRHYRVLVDPSRLPSSLSSGSAASVPIDLYTDRSGRPVRLRGSLALGGAQVTPTVTLSDYGKAVSISAPPASQVSG